MNTLLLLQVKKAKMIITMEEKLSGFGKVIKKEYETIKRVELNLNIDPLLQQIMDDLLEFGVIDVKR